MSITTMSDCDLHEPTAAKSPAAPLAAPFFGRLWPGIAARIERRRNRQALHHLEPRMLEDIGANPAEIYEAFDERLGGLHDERYRRLTFGAFKGGR